MAGTETGHYAMWCGVGDVNMNGLWDNRKGTTMVEILVVMVILLVGIMTVIQMFPTGFRVVRAAESQTIATKLAQAEVERWKNMPGNLPDGILPLNVNYGADLSDNDVQNDEDPGPPFEGFTGPAGATQYNPGNVIDFRYVRNETTPIPVGSYFTSGAGAAYGSKYTLAFSPIEVTANGSLYSGLSVKSGDLLRRYGDSQEAPPYLRGGQYAIDYTIGSGTLGSDNTQPDRQGKPVFYVAVPDRDTAHTYYISYSYWLTDGTGDTQLSSRTDQAFSPTADGDWQEVLVDVPAGNKLEEIESNTDSCARGLVQVTPQGWSTSDPYEFALVDSIMGVVAFNPRARNMREYTARGVRAITARIDYRIYDPRIIREDKVVPAPNEDPNTSGNNQHTAIKLALRFILNAGTPDSIVDGDPTDNPDEPTFEGLVKQRLGMALTNASQVLVKQSMLIIDLQTGLRVKIPDNTPTFQAIDYKAGVVHLPASADLIDWESKLPPGRPDCQDVTLQGRHLRFFYRADGDWSVQCQKAYSYYLRKWGTSQVDYWHFKLLAPNGGPYQLLFARCDSGKSVTVSYTYTDSGGFLHSVVGKTFKLSDDWVTDAGAGNRCSYVTLDVPAGATIDPAARIVVVGASFRARVIWRDGTHWRYVDIDTNLTRN